MTEETQPESEKAPEKEAQGPVAGERLAEARREQQINVLEVAKELHLDEPKVRAIERNDFDTLGAPVFAKGHLRKYAALVGVSEADVMDDYYTLTRAVDPPPVVAGTTPPKRELSPGPWIAIMILIAFIIFAYWWFVLRTPPVETATAEPVIEEPAETGVDAPDDTVSEPVVDNTPEPVVEEPVEDIVDAPPEPVIDDGRVELALTFSGDCWTEISDADGRRLYFGMGRAGATADLSGVAPISVLFGNADNVEMQVDGSNYRLPEPSSSSRAVRLTIIDRSAS